MHKFSADYWISQKRKYCDLCKCWITDNKPSVDFHEKGRRHQANIKRRLSQISHQSERNFQKAEQFDATLKQMESAALQAYRKDVENGADISSAALNKHLKDNDLVLNESSCAKKLWQEATSSDGRRYYQNILTNAPNTPELSYLERVVAPPKEGFASLKEQRQEADNRTKKQMSELRKFQQQQGLLQVQETKQQEAEEKARQAREAMKTRRVIEEEPGPTYGPLLEPGKNDPYGKWETVKDSTSNIDYQLPQSSFYYEVPVELPPEPEQREFKEKTVLSLDGEIAEPSFKKRKTVKRSGRQRVDDD